MNIFRTSYIILWPLFQELSASPDGDCCLFFGLRLSDDEDDGRSGGNDDSDVLRCRFSLSYLPTPLQANEEEEGEEGREVSSLDRLREKGAKSFSLTRDFQDFKVQHRMDLVVMDWVGLT